VFLAGYTAATGLAEHCGPLRAFLVILVCRESDGHAYHGFLYIFPDASATKVLWANPTLCV